MTDWATYYHTRFQYDARRGVVWREVCRWLEDEVPPDAAVLELGAGYCDFINSINARHKCAVDISETVRTAAAPGVETHVGSSAELRFAADATFDVVFASNLFEHLERDALLVTLRETRRVLKPGGKLIVIQPNFRYAYREYFDDFTHVGMFTDQSLPDLLVASGFEVSKVLPRFLPFSMKSGLPVHPLLVRLYLHSPWRPRAGQMLVIARKPGS